MFEQPTVFILGAGASWHYGYPTGEDLVKRVIEKSQQLQRYLCHGSLSESDMHYDQFKLMFRDQRYLPFFISEEMVSNGGLFNWDDVVAKCEEKQQL